MNIHQNLAFAIDKVYVRCKFELSEAENINLENAKALLNSRL